MSKEWQNKAVNGFNGWPFWNRVERMELPPMTRIAGQFYNLIEDKVNKLPYKIRQRDFNVSKRGIDVMVHESLLLQRYGLVRFTCEAPKITDSLLLKKAESLDFLAFPVIDQLLQWAEHFFRIGGTTSGLYWKGNEWYYDTPEDRTFDKCYTTLATKLASVMNKFSNTEKKATEERAKECEEIRKTEVAITEILKQRKMLSDQLVAITQEKTELTRAVEVANADKEAIIKRLRTEENEKKSLLDSQTEKNRTLENEIKTLKDKQTLILKEKTKYEESVLKLKQEVSSLVKIVAQQNAKKDEMSTKKFLNEVQEKEYRALASNRDRYHEESVKFTRDIAKLEGQVEVMRREKPRKEEDLRTLQMDNDKLDLNLASARSQKQAGEQEFATIMRDLNRTVNLHQETKHEITLLKNELARLENEKSDAQRLLDANRSTEINLSVLAAEKLRLGEKLRLAQQENYKQLEVLGNLTEYHTEVKQKLSCVEKETIKAAGLLKEKSADIEATEIRLRQADREVSEMKRKLSSVFDYLTELPLKNRWEIPPVLIVAVCLVMLVVLLMIILICIRATRSGPKAGGSDEDTEVPSPPPKQSRPSYSPRPYHDYEDEPEEERRSYTFIPRGKPVLMH